jgi:hypothetical protein
LSVREGNERPRDGRDVMSRCGEPGQGDMATCGGQTCLPRGGSPGGLRPVFGGCRVQREDWARAEAKGGGIGWKVMA